MSDRELIRRIAARYLIARDFFEIGDLILFGKYKNKKGVIVGWGKDHKGNPTVFIDPIPKGRKKTKEMGLFKFWHNPPPLIKKQQEEAAAQEALGIKVGCIIAVGQWGDKTCLFKNRDRNYEPELRVYHQIIDGTEVLYVKDELTGWVEGMNEHGIGVVNSALAVHADAKSGKAGKGKGDGDPSTQATLKDGKRVLKALSKGNIEDAVQAAQTHLGGLRGHTFIADADTTYALEATWRGHDFHVRKLPTNRKHVRTNHGQFHQDAGYTEEDGDHYLSSLGRRDQAMKVLRNAESADDIASAIFRKRRKTTADPLNMIKLTEGMRTTSQLMMNLKDLEATLYLIPKQVKYLGYQNDLPKKRKPKLQFKAFEYSDIDKDGDFDLVEVTKESSKTAALAKRVAAGHLARTIDPYDPMEYGPWFALDEKLRRNRDVKAVWTDRDDHKSKDNHHIVRIWISTEKHDQETLDRIVKEARSRVKSIRGAVTKVKTHPGRWIRLGRPDIELVAEFRYPLDESKLPQELLVEKRRYAKSRYKSKKKVKKQDGEDMTVYEYSDRQIADRNRDKAKRIEGLRKSVDKLRTQVKKDLGSSDEKTNAVALAVALMDHTFERVGNEGSAKEGHFGVTTWNVSHVKFSGGKATIKYVGKSGVDQKKTVTDAAIVKALKAGCKDKSKNACVVEASASDVNSYLKPFDISAKDIRGFHANTEMKAQLKKVRSGTIPSDKKEKAAKLKEEFKKALEETAKAVGHEPSTLKSQYLVPGLEEDYMKDGTINESHTKKGGRDRKDESQREDEQADKMIRKAPKLKPPRYDLRNNRTLKERDEDMEGMDKQDGGDEDLQKDVRRQARRVAFKWLALPREPSAQRMLMRMAAAKPDAATSQKGKAHRSNDPKNPGWIGMSPTGAPHFFPEGEFAEDKAKAYAKGQKFEEPKEEKRLKDKEEPEGETKPGAEEDVPTGEPTDKEVADGETPEEATDEEAPEEATDEATPEETPEEKPGAKKLSPEEKTKVKTLDARKKKTEKAIKDLKAKAQAAEGEEAKTLDKELKGKQKDLERHERQIAKIKGEDPPETEKDRTTRFEGEVDAKRQARKAIEEEILGTSYIQYSSAQSFAYLDNAFPYGDSWEELDGLTRTEINKARQKVNKFREKLKDNEQWIEANDNLASARDDLSENSEEPTGTPSDAPGKTREEQRETQHTDLKEELKALKKKKKSGKGEDGAPLLADEITELDAEIERKSTKVKEIAKQVAKQKKERDKAEAQVARERRQKGVGEATKITTELIGPGSTLPPKVKKALTKVLGDMSDLEAAIFAEEFKKELGAIVDKPNDTPEAATLANEAVKRAVGDIKDPKELAKAAAEIAYARNVVANPKILGGTKVSDEPKTPEQLAKRINEAAQHYKGLDHSLRLGAAETLNKELKDMDPKSNMAKELNGILTGIATAAVLDTKLSADGKKLMSDPTVPGRPQPSVKAVKLLQAMDRQGEEHLEQMFLPMGEGLTSPAGREALKQGMAALDTEDLIEQLTDGDSKHPMSPLTEMLEDLDLDEAIRAVIRKALIDMSIDSMTWGDAAIAEITNENDPNKRQSMFDQDDKEKREMVAEVVRAAKSGETDKFVSTNSEDDGSGVSNDEGVGLLDAMRAEQVSKALAEHSEGADAVPGAPAAAILREYADSKDPSVLETEVSPTPEEFRSTQSGKKSGSKSHLSVYRTAHISGGPSLDSVQSPAPTNRRQTSMPKITETGARQVTANLDRLATLFTSEFATLGLPRDVAGDMALRCDMLSDRIESHAGLRPRQAQMDPPANFTEEKVAPNEFNPAEIGEESSQAFLRNEDEPYMDAFTQDENDQLRQVQQDGMFSNAKAASELIRKLQARLAAGDSAQKKTELSDELARFAASLDAFADLDDKVAKFHEAVDYGGWTEGQMDEAARQFRDLADQAEETAAEIEAAVGAVLRTKEKTLEKEQKKLLAEIKKHLPETLRGQGKVLIELRTHMIKYAKAAERKRPGVKQMMGDPNNDLGADISERGGELLQRYEEKLGKVIAAQAAAIYDTVMEELTVAKPVLRGLEIELKEKTASGHGDKQAGFMSMLLKFREWLSKKWGSVKRIFDMGDKRIDTAAKLIKKQMEETDKAYDKALKSASDKSAGKLPAHLEKFKKEKGGGTKGDSDDGDDKKDDEKSDDKKDDKDSGKPWEKDKKAADHGFDLTA